MLAALAVILACRRMLLRACPSSIGSFTASCTGAAVADALPAEPTPETSACYERPRQSRSSSPLPMQAEPAQCATADLVRLGKILMPDRTPVALNPPPTILLRHGGSGGGVGARRRRRPPPPSLVRRLPPSPTVDSYQCRGRNNIPGAKLSEHGKGNALDISAIKLSNGATFNLTDPLVSKPFRERMRALACAPVHDGARARLRRLSQ